MKNNIIIGLVIIIAGVIFAGNELNLWDLNLFFNGWWSLFIIIPAIINIFRKDFPNGIIGLLIGVFLLLSANNIISWNLIWPLLIIILGISIMIPKGTISKNTNNANNVKNHIAIFSGTEEKVTGELDNRSITAIFGGVDLDLKESKIDKEVTINAICLFGGIEIIAPPDVYFEVKGFPIFGGIDNSTSSNSNKKVIINCICLFGGIDIK